MSNQREGVLRWEDGVDLPVRNVWCVGRNYRDHALEMGADPDREPPLFFSKPATSVATGWSHVWYPPQTTELHHEVELIVVLGTGGRRICTDRAWDHIAGIGVGVDLTRRCAQRKAKSAGKPWALSKGFDQSGPCSLIAHVSGQFAGSAREKGRIWLTVNGALRQESDVAAMTWSVAEIIAHLSSEVSLACGDVIFTGTPGGVGSLSPGDSVAAGVDGIADVRFEISASKE